LPVACPVDCEEFWPVPSPPVAWSVDAADPWPVPAPAVACVDAFEF
jgi:hypothetical protein